MIERYVFVKLEPAHESEADRERLAARIRALCAIAPVVSFTLAVPADASARAAWDLALTLRYASAADAAQYPASALHRELSVAKGAGEGAARERIAVVKTWTFQVV